MRPNYTNANSANSANSCEGNPSMTIYQEKRLARLEADAGANIPTVRLAFAQPGMTEEEIEAVQAEAMRGAPEGTRLITVQFVAASPDAEGRN